MRKFKNAKRIPWLPLIILFGTIAFSSPSFADEKDTANNASDPPPKSAPVRVDAPPPGLTERERWLLEQVEELKKRVAELEAKSNTPAAPVAAPAAIPKVATAPV